MFLNLTIIGVVALPNILIAFVQSIAPSDSIRGLDNILMIDSQRGPQAALFEILSAIVLVGCIAVVIAYHGPLYRFFRCRCRGEPVTDGVRNKARTRLLRSAWFTAIMVFIGLSLLNVYFIIGLTGSDEIQFSIGVGAKEGEGTADRTIVVDRSEMGRYENRGDVLHIIPLSITIQILITVYAFYQQNHRVKRRYFLHVYDRESVLTRPTGMIRSSIKRQIWTANALTTLLPMVLIIAYFFSFLTIMSADYFSRETLGALLGPYAPIVAPGEFGDYIYGELTNLNLGIAQNILYFTPIDTLFMIIGISIGVIVTIIYTYFIAKWSIKDIISPLRELQQNIKRTAEGDLTHMTVVRANDEIGEVSENFNHMVESLRKAETLESAKAAAESANRAKSAFLANMSHELRTPLNAILGFTQLMTRDSNLTPEQKQNLVTINRSGEHLLDLINDVLDVSKIESGRVTLNPSSFDLHYLLDGIEEMFALRAEKRGISLLFERSSSLPRYVLSDENKIRQIFMNLMSNAIKFTDEGGVSVRVGAEEESPPDARETRLQVEVEDTGPGIAPSDIETLFEPFVQTDSGKQAQEGTGLGLPISRKFVEMMGGSLRVSSVVGEGSRFSFDVVVVPGDEEEIFKNRPRRVTGVVGNASIWRLLIVEDRETNRLLLNKILQPLGFEIRDAENGQEGLDLWREWDPHLIFMDMQMPVMNGHEATKQIKATTRGQATVIIALTASAFEDQRDVILSEGCNDFIRKPFRENQVFGVMERHLGIEFVYEDLAAAPIAPAATHEVDGTTIAELPQSIRDSLRDATIAGDLDEILRTIESIRDVNPATADSLASLAHEFDYQAILDHLAAVQT